MRAPCAVVRARARVGAGACGGATERSCSEDRRERAHVVEHELVGVDVAVDLDVVVVHDDVARGSQPLLGRAEAVARLPAVRAGWVVEVEVGGRGGGGVEVVVGSRRVAEVGGGLGRVARRVRWGVVGGEGSGGVTGWVRAGRVYSTRAGNRRVHDAHPLEIVGLDSRVATQGQQVLVVGEEARDERVASARHHHVRRVLRVLDVPHLGHSYSARKRVKIRVSVREHHIAWLLQPLHDAATCSVAATRSWPGRRLPDANKPEDEPKEQHDGQLSSSCLRALLASRQMKTSERLRGTPRLPSITKIRENSALMSRADAN